MVNTIRIGMHKDGIAAIDLKRASNRHIMIVGRSGTGKSVAGQKIIRHLVTAGKSPVIVFDIHNLFQDENIFPEWRRDIKKLSNEIDVHSLGISVPLFTPLKDRDGKKEESQDIIMSIADVLSNSLKLGGRQKNCLVEAIEFVDEKSLFPEQGIRALDMALSMVGDMRALDIQNKLRCIFQKNVFHDGQLFIEDKKINILRLSKFSESTQMLIVEIMLTYIWRLANTGIFVEKGLCLFLDECQNFNWHNNGIIRIILSEGRRFGLQLILITQAIGRSQRDNMAHSLLQAENKLYFSPSENEIPSIAKLIGRQRTAYWEMQLKSLEVGECIAAGTLTINGASYEKPIKIKI